MPQLSPEMTLFFVSVFLNGILGLYFLFGIRPKHLGNYIIGVAFIADALGDINFILSYEDIIFTNALGEIFESIGIPAVYLYVKSYVIKDYKLAGKEWWHFSPVLIPTLLTIVYLFYKPAKAYVQPIAIAYFVLMFGLLFVYLYMGLRLAKKYKKEVSNKFSDLSRHNADWLIFLCYLVMLYSIFPFFISLFNYGSGISWDDYKSWQVCIVALIPLSYSSVFLWKVLQNAAMMQGIDAQDFKQKYASSKLDEQEKQTQLTQVQTIMERERAYLNPDLKITDLAKEMSTSSRAISQIINEKLNQNFYDFTNSYRIDYAKQMLRDSDSKQTISEILYASGFNSKSSFNTAFKKFTGQTPSQFRKQQ